MKHSSAGRPAGGRNRNVAHEFKVAHCCWEVAHCCRAPWLSQLCPDAGSVQSRLAGALRRVARLARQWCQLRHRLGVDVQPEVQLSVRGRHALCRPGGLLKYIIIPTEVQASSSGSAASTLAALRTSATDLWASEASVFGLSRIIRTTGLRAGAARGARTQVIPAATCSSVRPATSACPAARRATTLPLATAPRGSGAPAAAPLPPAVRMAMRRPATMPLLTTVTP